MREHRTDCKRRARLPLYKAMVEYGKEYFYIALLEKHPCSDKDELRKKGVEYIRLLKPSVNKKIEGRTSKDYYIDNEDHFSHRATKI